MINAPEEISTKDKERRLLAKAEHRIRLIQRERKPRRDGSRRGIDSLTFRYELVRCGKVNCAKCPHGPYWYAYWKEGGRTRSRYVGRELPERARKVYEGKQSKAKGEQDALHL